MDARYALFRGLLAAGLLLRLAGCCPGTGAHAQAGPGGWTRGAHTLDVAERKQSPSSPSSPTPAATGGLPAGERVADLEPSICMELLDSYDILFDPSNAEDVPAALRLRGPLSGVRFRNLGATDPGSVMDCRLTIALHDWARDLQRLGVREVHYFSAYRPRARVRRSGKQSGHARALALDVAALQFEDGTVTRVDPGWQDRDRGDRPCGGPHEEEASSRRLREAICRAVNRDLFQVVLTPHHDHDHRNHVHLEIVPGARWSFVR